MNVEKDEKEEFLSELHEVMPVPDDHWDADYVNGESSTTLSDGTSAKMQGIDVIDGSIATGMSGVPQVYMSGTSAADLDYVPVDTITRRLQPLCDHVPKKVTFLVDGFIPQGYISTIYGDGDQGKSYFALLLAVAVATGSPFLGRQTRQGKVLFVDGELSKDLQSERLRLICAGLGVDVRTTGNLYLETPEDLLTQCQEKDLVSCLTKLKKDEDFDLIILDSFGALFGINPESGQEVPNLFKRLQSLGSLLMTDHQPKNSQKPSLFGSVYKRNLTRSLWHVSAKELGKGNKLTFKHEKHNFSKRQDSFSVDMVFEEDAVFFRQAELDEVAAKGLNRPEQILSAMKKLGDATAVEIGEEIGLSAENVRSYITDLKEVELLEPVGKKGKAIVYRGVE